jgi:hypothetical protein
MSNYYFILNLVNFYLKKSIWKNFRILPFLEKFSKYFVSFFLKNKPLFLNQKITNFFGFIAKKNHKKFTKKLRKKFTKTLNFTLKILKNYQKFLHNENLPEFFCNSSSIIIFLNKIWNYKINFVKYLWLWERKTKKP